MNAGGNKSKSTIQEMKKSVLLDLAEFTDMVTLTKRP